MIAQYSSLNFGLGETLDMLREHINSFAAAEIAPRAEQIDHDNEFPNDLWRKSGDMGLLAITVKEEYGGVDMGYLAHMIAMEEISRASASVGLSYGAHSNLCVNQINRFSSFFVKKHCREMLKTVASPVHSNREVAYKVKLVTSICCVFKAPGQELEGLIINFSPPEIL